MKFLDLFKKYIKYHESTFDHFDKRKKGTIYSYYNRYNLVVDFLIENKLKDIECKNFTISVGKTFFNWLGQQGKSHNYCVRVVQATVTVLNYGAANELIEFNPLASLRLRKVPPGLPVHLTVDELIKLQEYQPTGRMYQKAKDLFMFQCLTGLDYGDVTTVRKSNLFEHKGRMYIIKARKKTGTEAIIPYTDQAKVIFEKYDHKLSVLSNQKYNELLKKIAERAGIEKHITTHIGRKTYAMYMLNQEQYTLEALSKILGHKRIATTETYYTQRTLELVHRAVKDHEERER